jgi:hypothetical protein
MPPILSGAGLPGGDPFAANAQTAADAVEEQRRRANEASAMAAQNSRTAIVDAKGQIDQRRQMAMDQALAEARGRGSDQAALDVVGARVSAPYLSRGASLDQGQATRQQDYDFRQSGANDYFSQVAPAVQGGHDRALAAYQRERAQQDAERAYQQQQLEQQMALARLSQQGDAEDRAWRQAQADREFNYKVSFDKQQFDEDVRRYGIEQANKLELQRQAAASRGSGGGGGGGGSSGYYGTGQTKTEIKDAFGGMLGQLRGAIDPSGIGGTKFAKIAGVDKLLQGIAGYNVGKQLGVPGAAIPALMPKYSMGLTQTNQGKLAPTGPGGAFQPNTPKLTPEAIYQQAVDAINTFKAQGLDDKTIVQRLRAIDLSPATSKAISDYLPGWS